MDIPAFMQTALPCIATVQYHAANVQVRSAHSIHVRYRELYKGFIATYRARRHGVEVNKGTGHEQENATAFLGVAVMISFSGIGGGNGGLTDAGVVMVRMGIR
jgi:hypothetical protein